MEVPPETPLNPDPSPLNEVAVITPVISIPPVPITNLLLISKSPPN